MATKKKKNKKLKKNKEFIRNICIGIVSMIIVACIINIAPGYRRDKYKDIINLVITDENVTEKLKHIIYVNDNETVYMSKEDVCNFIDKTIYYDETSDIVITTSQTCTASMKPENNEISINGAKIQTLDSIIYLDEIMYIPISELESVYNIKIDYKKASNIVVIDYLNKGMITAEINENTKMQYRPRGLSKKVKNLEKSERVYAFYTTSKGWRLIRTEDGTIGYVKSNKLTNEYIVRQDMESKELAKTISMDMQNNSIQQINDQKILIKDMFIISADGVTTKEAIPIDRDSSTKIWANASFNKNLSLEDYNKRTELTNNIVSMLYSYKINGINLNINDEIKGIDRLIIELAPRLREMGISTNIVLNQKISKEQYEEIADYLIMNQ